MGELVPLADSAETKQPKGFIQVRESEYVTFRLHGQHLGFSVLDVEDVIRPRRMTPVRLASPVIAGLLNLRGRIVTAIDLRERLGLPRAEKPPESAMSIVASYEGNLYCFIIDEIGDVLSLPDQDFEKCPSNLESAWRDVASGVFQLEEKLLVVLDVERLLSHEYLSSPDIAGDEA